MSADSGEGSASDSDSSHSDGEKEEEEKEEEDRGDCISCDRHGDTFHRKTTKRAFVFESERRTERAKETEAPPKPRPLHLTTSLFIRSIPPEVSKEEITAVRACSVNCSPLCDSC